jgi:hypothetical protein
MQTSASAGVGAFVGTGAHWRIALDIVLLGVFGGFYTVPLYALIQTRSQPSHRSRIIAANNILNAVFIVVSAIVAIGLLAAGVTIPQLFLVVGVMNALVAVYIYRLVPEFLMRFLAWLLVHTVYPYVRTGLRTFPTRVRVCACATTSATSTPSSLPRACAGPSGSSWITAFSARRCCRSSSGRCARFPLRRRARTPR